MRTTRNALRAASRVLLSLASLLTLASTACAQVRPYIGFVYPAGGQQGTTVQIRLGGQNLDGASQVHVSGRGVSARLLEYQRRLNPQEITLLREQRNELKRAASETAKPAMASSENPPMASEPASPTASTTPSAPSARGEDEAALPLIERIDKRIAGFVQRPACASISSLAIVEIAIAPDAEPGPRELYLVTQRGVSNPLAFHVGQLPEFVRKPMATSVLQVLGKEEQALRKRPENEAEQSVNLPCTLNGQIASGEVNRYRFQARQGQRLVISTCARQLIPYIADAVPGWFQPVLALYDERGKEVAYNDDYRFQPDPTILFEVPADGQYVLHVSDAIYRGREDFVYRITLGELPFITGIFPLGARAGDPVKVEIDGWNLEATQPKLPAPGSKPGLYQLVACQDRFVSNRVPFAIDVLPDMVEHEPNDDVSRGQEVQPPLIVNGRIDGPDDWDMFQVEGRAGETLVAEVSARRLGSPLDSMLKLTDADGKVLAVNDDWEDLGAGLSTHHADSYLMAKLPADGRYFVHLGDTARHGGREYAYRLRISAPQPDFELQVTPSSIALRSKGAAALGVHVVRKDGFAGPIKLGLKDPPPGFSAPRSALSPTQDTTRLALRTSLTQSEQPLPLTLEGRATIGSREVVHEAVPAEDRMQAFLWRHLVPAEELKTLVFDPSVQAPPKRVRREPPPPSQTTAATDSPAEKPKFTKQQVAGRLRQLRLLFEEGLLTDEFHDRKVAECEAIELQ